MIRTEDDVRAAFHDLAAGAPIRVGDRPDFELARVDAPRPRGRFAVVALAAAAVAAVVVGASFVAHQTRRTPTGAPSFRTATSLDFESTWDFGPTSFPGLSLGSSLLTPNGAQDYLYVGADQGSARLNAYVRTFEVDSVIAAEVAALTPTPIGDTNGYSGVLTAGTDALHHAMNALPYKPTSMTPTAYVFWPVGGDRWAVLSATQIPDDPTNQMVGEPVTALIPIAAGAQVETDANVAFVKIAYLPADAQFAAVSESADIGFGGGGYVGITDQAERVVSFVRRGTDTTVLSVSAVLGPAVPLTDGSGAQLPGVINGAHGPYDRTTIEGHDAFVSDNCIVIQWGGVEIALTDASEDNNPDNTDGHPMYPRAELLKVAQSMAVSPRADFGHGYPLIDSLPASAFGQ